jgi:WD40 repeat protein
MRRTLSLLLLLVVNACQIMTLPSDKLDIDSLAIPTAEATAIPITQVLPSPTAKGNSVSIGYMKKCLQVEKRASGDVVLEGHIIAEANDIYRLFSRLVTVPSDEIFENELGNVYVQVVGISPDGKWLVYEREDAPGNFLTIEGFSWTTDTRWATEIRAIPRDKFTWASWLDSERLVFDFYLENPLVVYMLNGEAENIYVRYPEFYLDDAHAPLFSRDLNRMVAYRNLPEEPPSIVLWDLPSKSEIQRLYIAQESISRNLVRVSPNGEHIAVSGALEFFYDALFHDIFLMDWDGNVKQLTTFRDSGLTASLIEQFQWSPDGHYLAFWLNESLAVYDTVTQDVTDYCIRSSNSMSFPPYWSPDSQQIVFNGYAPDSNPIIVVDIVNGTAMEIQESDYHVIGWMLDIR